MLQNFIENFEKKSQNKGFHVCLFFLAIELVSICAKKNESEKPKERLHEAST